MAIVKEITPETIERMRGVIDFYMLRGITPVARSWPKKPKPPYTALQAEAMAVFSIACANMKRLSPNMLQTWQKGSEGKREQWTDVFKGIVMKYWKLKRAIPLIATDFEVVEDGDKFKVVWDVLQVYIDPLTPEEETQIESILISKEDIEKAPEPMYFTLYDDEEIRLVSPFILFEMP